MSGGVSGGVGGGASCDVPGVESGDVFDPPTADRLREWIYSSGNSVEPSEAYRQFKGRDPTVEPMLKKKGLLAEAA